MVEVLKVLSKGKIIP